MKICRVRNRQLSSLDWWVFVVVVIAKTIYQTCFPFFVLFTYAQWFYIMDNLQELFAILVMGTWTSVNLTQFAERCFEMTKGRYILWSRRNFRTYFQFLTETRYASIASWTYFIFFRGIFQKKFPYVSEFSFLFLSAGWTSRQGRICIVLE
jgi:hypothetical protein